MKKISILFLLSSLFLASVLNAGLTQERRILTSTKILKNALNLPKTGITKALLHNAKAIAVFPNTVKSAFFIGGRMGKGILSVKDANGKWSEPIFMSIDGLSLGMQFGVSSTDIIMVFKTGRSLDGLSEGKVTIGLDAEVVAFAKGAQVSSKTDGKLAANIQSFGKSSGAFVGISIGGTSLNVSNNDDFDYYGDIIYVGDIIHHDKIRNKSEAAKFKSVLESF
ncbi:MAG: lipid-binding SYLF domain-containing protein [Epsilonproteobacteria bacterium]|nr:lipid-binding SYLF domain-containing protein [Campylobacterota bacterium]